MPILVMECAACGAHVDPNSEDSLYISGNWYDGLYCVPAVLRPYPGRVPWPDYADEVIARYNAIHGKEH